MPVWKWQEIQVLLSACLEARQGHLAMFWRDAMIELIGPGRRTPGWAERGKEKENIPLPPGRRLRISDLPQQNRNLNAGLPRPGLFLKD